MKKSLLVFALLRISIESFSTLHFNALLNNVCPADTTVLCNADYSPSVTGYPLLDAGYDEPQYWDEIVSTSCPIIITRHWTSYNALNEAFQCDQTITLIDNVPPNIIIDANLNFNCSDNISLPYTIEDCDANTTTNIIWGAISPDSSGICAAGSFRTQTQGGWGAEPNGDNPGTYLHTHFASAFPNGLTVGCNNTLTLSSAQDVTNFLPSGSMATALPVGNMLNPGESYSNVLAGQLVAATLNATFDLYDQNFGVDEEWVGNLIVGDGAFEGMSLIELINIANNMIGGCGSSYSFSQINEALTLFNQNFDDGIVNNNYLICGGEANPCLLYQEFTVVATDHCGNTTSVNGTITLNDNTAPEFINALEEITIDCSMWPLDTIKVEDPCGISAVVISITETEFSGPCLPVIERIYNAMDACGNVSSFTQYIHITDTTAPVASSIPVNMSLSCADELSNDVPVFSDNCDTDLEIEFTELITGSNCAQMIMRTWTATDVCGNSTNVSQTISIADSMVPIFTYLPTDTTMECGTALPTAFAMALDNCSLTTISHNDIWVTTSGECKKLKRTYTATDACGNAATAEQYIHFLDNIAPTFSSMPEDESGNCSINTAAPTLTATDNCTSNVQVQMSETQTMSGCTITKTRIWTATDECGNTASHTQTLTIDGNAPPQFNASDSVSIPCNQVGSYTITVIDNCSQTNLTYNDIASGNSCNTQFQRTWIATDACGNSAQFVQTIHLYDSQSPIFTFVPQSYSISCGTTPPIQNAVANDNCTPNLVPTMTQTTAATGCQQIITRTWTVTDNCGNTATATQTINIIDNVNPVFTGVPMNITISCGQVPQVPNVTATDNCAGNLQVSFAETTAGAGCDAHIVRMWTATDLCGNTITATQHIYIDDNTPPTWTNVPAALTLSCNASVPALVNPTATDNCSSVANSFYFEFNESVPCGHVLHRVWQATDACGNASSASQLISFLDNTAPIFTSTPASILEAECNNIPNPFTVQAQDNCSSVSISFSETIIANGCPYTLRRTWIATDNCGNHTSYIQNILISDNEQPMLHNVPGDTTIACGTVAPIATVTATDNCSGILSVTTQDELTGNGCEQTIIRTFSATDLCGNTTISVQNIYIIDTTAPLLFDTPANVEVSCENIPAAAQVTAIDACEGILDVQYSEEIIELNSELVCALSDAQSFMGNIAFWLPGLNGISSNYVFVDNSASISINNTAGTATVSGELVNTTNPDQRWLMTLELINQRNWEEWSVLGRSYKDDLNIAGTNYLNWSYYELSPSSQLIGAGLLAGSLLQITHAPSTYHYGFQIGLAANNRNMSYGMSGWIYYNGSVNGSAVSGHGDFYAENTCCPERQIIRQWLATDCAGNTTVHTQQIHVFGSGPIAQTAPIVNGMEMEVYYTSNDRFNVNIQTNRTTNVTVEFYTNSGQFLGSQTKYLNHPNIPCKIEIDGQLLENGMYLFRAYDSSQSVTKRALKIR